MEESNVEEEEINLESDEEQDSLNKMLISQKSDNFKFLCKKKWR